jgi:hypothetical protein
VRYDQAGNVTEAVWRFTVDSQAWVQVTGPLSGTLTNQETVTLTIDTEAGRPVTITVSGLITQVYTTTNGRLVVPGWPLAEGANAIAIQAEDPAGNLSNTGVSVTRDPAQQAAAVYGEKDSFTPNPVRRNGIMLMEQLAFYAGAAPRSGDWQAAQWIMHINSVQRIMPCDTTLSGVVPQREWVIYWDGYCNGGQAPDGSIPTNCWSPSL